MKNLYRAFKVSLWNTFCKLGFGKGMHHWTVERWFNETEEFLKKLLGHTLPEAMVYGTILLLYHSFGAKAKRILAIYPRATSKEYPDLKVFEGLAET